jgi:hypothetical protein
VNAWHVSFESHINDTAANGGNPAISCSLSLKGFTRAHTGLPITGRACARKFKPYCLCAGVWHFDCIPFVVSAGAKVTDYEAWPSFWSVRGKQQAEIDFRQCPVARALYAARRRRSYRARVE